jgi:hypothetical protein
MTEQPQRGRATLKPSQFHNTHHQSQPNHQPSAPHLLRLLIAWAQEEAEPSNIKQSITTTQ